jgi:hypothetical protein
MADYTWADLAKKAETASSTTLAAIVAALCEHNANACPGGGSGIVPVNDKSKLNPAPAKAAKPRAKK